MKHTINRSQFHDAFRQSGLGDRFSHKALDALFSYFEDLEELTEEEMELDVLGICCEYSEDHWEAIADNFSIELPEEEDEKIAAVRDFLENETTFVKELSEGVFVYQQFKTL